MFKKENHNIPKDFDKSLNESKPKTSVLVVSAKTRKKINFNKWYLVIIGLIMVIFLLGGYLYFNQPSSEDIQELAANEQESNALASEISKKLDNPPAESETSEAKEQYYRDTLWLKTSEGDDVATAKYYMEEVVPRRIVIGIDIKEALILPLVKTDNKSEAKKLLSDVKAEYSNSLKTVDPIAKVYVESKLARLAELEESLR